MKKRFFFVYPLVRRIAAHFVFFGIAMSIQTAGAAQVNLTWDAPDASVPSGYQVYYGTASGISSGIYEKKSPAVTDTRCTVDIEISEEGKTYYFVAKALYPDGSISGPSNEVSKYIPKTDSDGDGISDSDEISLYGTNPNDQDTDGDGLDDGDEIYNYDSDPNNMDTDGDGLIDGDEIAIYFTEVNNPDTDEDGTLDGEEIHLYYTDPKNSDTSGIIEAESGALMMPMGIISDSSVSGGAYIATTRSESGTSEYSFSIAQPGVYIIKAMVFAANAGSDSFYVNLDSQGEFIWDLNPTASPDEFNIWRLDEITNRGNGSYEDPQYNPYKISLDEGVHKLIIRGRESSAKLDYFYFEKIEISQKFSFDSNDNGFSYRDDLFRGTTRPAYASGSYGSSIGYKGGGLSVSLGGIDSKWVLDGMSGGWSKSFEVGMTGPVSVSLRYRLTMVGQYEPDEYSQVLAAVDGKLIGIAGKDYLLAFQGTDGDTSMQDSGWRTATLELNLSRGVHTIAFGAWNSKKTGLLEATRAYFDDISINPW